VSVDDIHVMPMQDLVEHADDDCVCGPTTHPVSRNDGSYGWVVIHHSLDGRESYELPVDLRVSSPRGADDSAG